MDENKAKRAVKIINNSIESGKKLRDKWLRRKNYIQAAATDSYISGLTVAIRAIQREFELELTPLERGN